MSDTSPPRIRPTRSNLKAGACSPLSKTMLDSGLINPADDPLTKHHVRVKEEEREAARAVAMVDEKVGSRRPTRMPRLGCARTTQHARRRTSLTPRMQIRRETAPETAPAPSPGAGDGAGAGAPPPAWHGDVVQAEAASAAAAKGAVGQYIDGATAGWAGCNVGDAMPAGSSAPAPSHGSGVPSLCRYDNVIHVIQG